jgi:hypothetical protein
MSSFARPRARRRNGSSPTARPDRSPPGSTASSVPAPLVTLEPDADSNLADGIVVETRLVARLLGVRLLRVDGVVLLSPGRVRAAHPAVRPADHVDHVTERQASNGVRPGERLALAGHLIASTGSRLERTRKR